MPAPPKVATSFQEILEQVWWRLDTALDLEMIRWSAMLGALEALENGTTAIVDHHESPNAIEGSLDVIAEACAEVGVRSVVAYGITDRHGPDGARRGLAENERFLRAGGRGLVGIHAAFTCSDASLEAAAGLAADLGVGVHVHVAEGPGDVDAPRRLDGLTRDDWLLAHCVHLPTDHALRGTILHNPMSNLNNAVGYANPARFANRVALGTDGIGGNVLEAFRLAYVLQRSVDVTCGPDPAWAWLRGRLGPRAGGARGRGRVVVRPDGPLARRLHARGSARCGSRSAARSSSRTAARRASTPTRSGRRPASRPPACTHGSDGGDAPFISLPSPRPPRRRPVSIRCASGEPYGRSRERARRRTGRRSFRSCSAPVGSGLPHARMRLHRPPDWRYGSPREQLRGSRAAGRPAWKEPVGEVDERDCGRLWSTS